MPVFGISRHFSRARQLIGAGAQKVTADDVAEGPTAGVVFGYDHLELGARFLFFVFAGDVTEGVDGQIFVEVGF